MPLNSINEDSNRVSMMWRTLLRVDDVAGTIYLSLGGGGRGRHRWSVRGGHAGGACWMTLATLFTRPPSSSDAATGPCVGTVIW